MHQRPKNTCKCIGQRTRYLKNDEMLYGLGLRFE